jgi:exosortase K
MQRPASLACASIYALGALVLVGLKRLYSTADAAELAWILTPTCWLARTLGGIQLEAVEGVGFVSHAERIVVGPPCAGVNFLVICAGMLFFSFVGRFRAPWGRALWLPCSGAAAYAATLGANTLRIVLAARLYALDPHDAALTPEMLHRLAGTLLYSLSLLGVYLCAEAWLGRAARTARALPGLVPCAWYLGVTLGVPLVTRAYREDPARFLTHAGCVVGVAVAVLLLASLPALLRDRLYSRGSAR